MAQTAADIYLKHQRDDDFEILCQKPQVSTGQIPSQQMQAEDAGGVLTLVAILLRESFAFGNKVKETEGFPESFVFGENIWVVI